MTTYESALPELSGRLIGTGSNLKNSLSESPAVALQELIEAELTAAIGAALGERTRGPVGADAACTDRSCWRPRRVMSTWPSRNCESAASSPNCSSRAGGSIERFGQ